MRKLYIVCFKKLYDLIRKQNPSVSMSKTLKSNILDNITATIVYRKSGIGVFHYNKLSYLVEYFFIKNFGKRLTGEKFIKFPHGPVIVSYVKQIEKLNNLLILKTDINEIKRDKQVDDFNNRKIPIYSTEKTKEFLHPDQTIVDFIYRVVDKYSHYNSDELEKLVYSTVPMINYEKKSFFKLSTGGLYTTRGLFTIEGL